MPHQRISRSVMRVWANEIANSWPVAPGTVYRWILMGVTHPDALHALGSMTALGFHPSEITEGVRAMRRERKRIIYGQEEAGADAAFLRRLELPAWASARGDQDADGEEQG